jgi:hypothetical protein
MHHIIEILSATDSIMEKINSVLKSGGLREFHVGRTNRSYLRFSDERDTGYISGGIDFYEKEYGEKNLHIISAEDFLANPRLIPFWDDGKPIEPITPILKGSTMSVFEVIVTEKADKEGKNERIVQPTRTLVADSAKSAEFQAIQEMIQAGLEADPNRLEVLVRPFLK